MTVREFFDRYVYHEDACLKGRSSPVCTCGLMQNLPTIYVYALEGEKAGRRELKEA